MTAKLITVDGPSGSGKGTLCQAIAQALGFHLLDSGALYRIVGLAAEQQGVSFDDGDALAALALALDVSFLPAKQGEPSQVILNGKNISDVVRHETTGELASKVAIHPAVREALLDMQRQFAIAPGLVADGRDMGTVVFPEAPFKFYLTASAEVRAERRLNQLQKAGKHGNLATLLEDIKNRDERDMNRAVAPLKPAADALVIDSSNLSINEVIEMVLAHINK